MSAGPDKLEALTAHSKSLRFDSGVFLSIDESIAKLVLFAITPNEDLAFVVKCKAMIGSARNTGNVFQLLN